MKVGVLGKRGIAYVPGLRSVPEVQVIGFGDLDPANEALSREQNIPEFVTSLEELVDRCDAVVISTPMHLHASQSILALAKGCHVLSEVTAAVTIEECRDLRNSAKGASNIYGFAENYCYFENNLIALELVKQGRFGPLYYGEGDYVHEVRFLQRNPDQTPTWRMQWQVGSRGNTYCTHELGPLMRMFRAQDPEVRVESVACFGTGAHTDLDLPHDDSSLTLVRLSNRALIKLRLDMISNRPHRIRYELQGVNGVYESEEESRIWFGENRSLGWNDPQREWSTLDRFRQDLPESLLQELAHAGDHGHSGGDYFVGRRFAQAITGQTPIEIGIQDAIEWTMVGLLSQASIAQGSIPLPMPSWVYDSV